MSLDRLVWSSNTCLYHRWSWSSDVSAVKDKQSGPYTTTWVRYPCWNGLEEQRRILKTS